ncbi:hypothetical protein EYF80_051054 [Liparis tanakae]|uniref:Uncharacterized protein n=1 Tax=Liparis tanakae TaxID=230148 RepID=A0A4Z2FC52_9TELE|nr:hypothetical protein EYF80_051054 [Liparis tanakae]
MEEEEKKKRPSRQRRGEVPPSFDAPAQPSREEERSSGAFLWSVPLERSSERSSGAFLGARSVASDRTPVADPKPGLDLGLSPRSASDVQVSVNVESVGRERRVTRGDRTINPKLRGAGKRTGAVADDGGALGEEPRPHGSIRMVREEDLPEFSANRSFPQQSLTLQRVEYREKVNKGQVERPPGEQGEPPGETQQDDEAGDAAQVGHHAPVGQLVLGVLLFDPGQLDHDDDEDQQAQSEDQEEVGHHAHPIRENLSMYLLRYGLNTRTMVRYMCSASSPAQVNDVSRK